jgi:hypothetical protein
MPCPSTTTTPSDLNSSIKIPAHGIFSPTNISDGSIFRILRIYKTLSGIELNVEFASTSSEKIIFQDIRNHILAVINNPHPTPRKWGASPSWVLQGLNNRCRVSQRVAENALTNTLTTLDDGENINMIQGTTSEPRLQKGNMSDGSAYYTTMTVILSLIPLLSKQNSSVGIINQPSVNNKFLIAAGVALYDTLDQISDGRPHKLIKNTIFPTFQ